MKLTVNIDMRNAPGRWIALVLQRARDQGLSFLLNGPPREFAVSFPRKAGNTDRICLAPAVKGPVSGEGGIAF